MATPLAKDPITLAADGSGIHINTALLPAPDNIYDADVGWVRRGPGYVSFFFGKLNSDPAAASLRTRLEIKYAPEAFIRHLWSNSREFHEKTREILRSWPSDPLVNPQIGRELKAERDHSEWANFDYMARSGTQGTIDFFLLPAAGVARFAQGLGSAGLVMASVVRVHMTVYLLASILDEVDALAGEVRQYVPQELLGDD